MTDPLDGDAAEMLALLDESRCDRCHGMGVVTDAAPVAGALWLIAWRTAHAAWCSGGHVPEVAYVMDLDAIGRGDHQLPGQPEPRCSAVASLTGRRCRNRPGPGGLCPAHRPRVGGRP